MPSLDAFRTLLDDLCQPVCAEAGSATRPNPRGRGARIFTPGDASTSAGHVEDRSVLPEEADPVAFFANGIGDHILLLPTLRALAARFAGRLTLVCAQGRHARHFSGIPLRRVVEVPFWCEKDRGYVFDVEEVASAVEKCDLFLSLVPWHSAELVHLVERLAPARSIGFDPSFSCPVEPKLRAHSADQSFGLALSLDPGLRLEDFAGPPALVSEAVSLGLRLRAALAPGMRILAVHNESLTYKVWNAQRLVEALDCFLGRHRDFVAIVVDRRPSAELAHVDRLFSGGTLPIGQAFLATAQADLFLGIDSCMLHMADFCRVPGVGLFGPTDPTRWGFRLGPHRHVFGKGSMDGVAVHQVHTALESLWSEFFGGDGEASDNR